MLSPLLEHVSEEGADTPAGSQPVDLVTVDTDVEVDLAREFGVRTDLSIYLYRLTPDDMFFANPYVFATG
jgi:hypothetical protein